MVTSTSTPGSRLMLVYKENKYARRKHASCTNTHDLLDDLAGGVEIDQTLVDLKLIAIPGLGTLTARLDRERA